MDPQSLLASTAPLAGTTAVLGLVGVVAALLVVLCQPAPWTPTVAAEALLRALLVTAQTFGGVTLADRLVTKGGAAMGSAAATPPSTSRHIP